MTSPVNSSSSSASTFFSAQLNNNPLALADSSAASAQQQECECLRKQLEDKDLQVKELDKRNGVLTGAIKNASEQNARLREENRKKDEQLETLAATELRAHNAEREVCRYREVQVQAPLEVPLFQHTEQESTVEKVWRGFKSGVNSVGKFCYKHRPLFNTAFGIVAVVLCVVFPVWAIPIALSLGAATAFFHWVTEGFK